MTKFHQLTPNLMVNNVNATVEFYQNILNFELEISVPQDGDFVWAMVKKDNVCLMFQDQNSIQEEYPTLKNAAIGGSLTLYIKTENISDLFSKLQKQTDIITDLHETCYGTKEFAIKDINGFILTFAEGKNG